jgi:hypothetical protein
MKRQDLNFKGPLFAAALAAILLLPGIARGQATYPLPKGLTGYRN